jgi:bacillopeptidase F
MRGASTVEPNLAVVRAPELWALGFEGQGLVVAVLDSGVDPAHVDLISRWRDGSNSWFDPNGEYASPHDATGHGTQVTGLLVGGSSGGTAIGVAPGAEWIAAKIFDDQGEATFSAIHQSLAWVLDPDGDPETDDAPDVVNNSWGLTDDVGDCVLEFQTDIELLKAAGIAVVFAAGNEGPWPASSVSPANNPAGFAIGAVDNAWILESSTSRGPSACAEAVYPEIVAPGVLVWTSDITLGGVFPFSYVEASGTSFAAPHASGALTLLRQAFPAASVAMLEQALMLSAVDLGPAGPDGSYGYGAVDLVAAHAWLDAPTTCTDDDGDGAYEEGVGCGLLDCDDGNATAWHVPSEALGLRFDTDTRLVWAPPASPGGSLDSLRYDTLRTTTPDNFTGATCVATDDATSEAVDDPDVPGHAFYYLVRADNDCGDNLGSLGTDSSAVPRDGADCP